MSAFVEALENNDLKSIRKISKADLHNHFVLGGNRNYIFDNKNFLINPIESPLSSMDMMNEWSQKNIDSHFDSSEMRKFLIDAAFVQAAADGVKIIEIGEDVWGLGEFFHNDIGELIDAFYSSREKYAPDTELRLQIGMSRHCPIDYLLDCLKPFWGHKEFYSIDLYGDEMAQPIDNFIPIYERAKEEGLCLKAHIGEWGSADDVIHGAKVLHLNEIQHGIAAASSDEAIDFLKENNIRLNITPSSNILLGRVSDMSKHPIAKLFRCGVDVTVNSDDILIFDSDVSKEYQRLYNSGCLLAWELDEIRLNGLKNRGDLFGTDVSI